MKQFSTLYEVQTIILKIYCLSEPILITSQMLGYGGVNRTNMKILQCKDITMQAFITVVQIKQKITFRKKHYLYAIYIYYMVPIWCFINLPYFFVINKEIGKINKKQSGIIQWSTMEDDIKKVFFSNFAQKCGWSYLPH